MLIFGSNEISDLVGDVDLVERFLAENLIPLVDELVAEFVFRELADGFAVFAAFNRLDKLVEICFIFVRLEVHVKHGCSLNHEALPCYGLAE